MKKDCKKKRSEVPGKKAKFEKPIMKKYGTLHKISMGQY